MTGFRVRGEIETEAALDAEKIFVDAGEIAIVGAQDFVIANAKSCFAAVRTVSADGGSVIAFPRGAFCNGKCRW